MDAQPTPRALTDQSVVILAVGHSLTGEEQAASDLPKLTKIRSGTLSPPCWALASDDATSSSRDALHA